MFDSLSVYPRTSHVSLASLENVNGKEVMLLTQRIGLKYSLLIVSVSKVTIDLVCNGS